MKNSFFSCLQKMFGLLIFGGILFLVPKESLAKGNVPSPMVLGINLTLNNPCGPETSYRTCRILGSLVNPQIVDNRSLSDAFLTSGKFEAVIANSTSPWHEGVRYTITFGN